MSVFVDFVIKRNLRVIFARSRGWLHAKLNQLFQMFGGGWRTGPQMSVYGVPMMPNYADKTYRYCHYGTYGTYLSDYIAKIDDPFIFIDIGANQGLYSLVAAANPHCGHIIAMEPVPATFDFLKANIALNKAEDRATLLNAALSDTTGSTEIHMKQKHSGAATLGGHLGEGGVAQTIQLMCMADLDAYIPEGARIVVKVDVEGHEDVVIAQLVTSAHTGRVAAVFYEMDERYADAAPIEANLRGAGLTRFTKYGIRRHYDMLAEREGA